MRLILLIIFSLLAFAGNALLSRLALKGGYIDPASFVTIRMVSAAVPLAVLVLLSGQKKIKGSWRGAVYLLLYAIPFTFAYAGMSAATGALISFGMVQITMVCAGWYAGERFQARQMIGLLIAFAGLLILLLPGATAPGLMDTILMAVAGCAWGFYSLNGRGSASPGLDTAGNFIRALPVCLLIYLPFSGQANISTKGILLAVISGTITSAVGYILWYEAMKKLSAARAATIQLSVPVITSLLAVFLLNELLDVRIISASVIVLTGIGVVLVGKRG